MGRCQWRCGRLAAGAGTPRGHAAAEGWHAGALRPDLHGTCRLSWERPRAAGARRSLDPPAPVVPAERAGACPGDSQFSGEPAEMTLLRAAVAAAAVVVEVAARRCRTGGCGEEAAAAPAVAQDNPVGAMQSIGTMRVGEASQAMGSATASVSTQMSQQRSDLASAPPTIERPTGSPQGAAGAMPGNVPVSPPGPDPAPIPAAAAGQPVPLPPAPAAPQPGAPVTQTVAPPRVAGTAQGQVSESDARRVQEAVGNVPVTDEALNVDAGAVPDLPLGGTPIPLHADAQRTALLDKRRGRNSRARRSGRAMGEEHLP